jgi:hypothetical protein
LAISLGASVGVNIQGNYSNPTVLGAPVDNFVKNIALALTSGTGANQVDRMWYAERTLNSGANEDLDLVGGFTDSLGVPFSPARFRALLIYSLPGNTTPLVVKPGAANGIVGLFGAPGHTLTIRPGGLFLVFGPDAIGYALTTGTGDVLNIANGAGAPATYDIVLLAASA